MRDRAADPLDPFCPEVVGSRLQGHEAALEHPLPVGHEGDVAPVLPVERGDEAEIGQDLETVADAEHEIVAGTRPVHPVHLPRPEKGAGDCAYSPGDYHYCNSAKLSPKTPPVPRIVKEDPWLEPASAEISARIDRYRNALCQIEEEYGTLTRFADAYNYFGIHVDPERKAWVFREWAPGAEDLYLFGDFNDWQRYSHRMTRKPGGVWEIYLPMSEYRGRFTHLSRVKVLVHSEAGWNERIPSYIRRVEQDPVTHDFTGQVWLPPKKFNWEGDRFNIGSLKELVIYEAHVGMAQERAGVGVVAGLQREQRGDAGIVDLMRAGQAGRELGNTEAC